jgi:Zn-dependent metalloprotease
MQCGCCIVPADVLARFATDKRLSKMARASFARTARFESHWRALRALQISSTEFARQSLAAAGAARAIAKAPTVTVYDCRHSTALPGAPVARPGTSADATAKRGYLETTALAQFYHSVFGRNSVDGRGVTLQSSIHYGVKFNNAFWNGVQMTYGDGDGTIFRDFTRSNDVIAHELTHGVTQYSAQLAYENEAGGLNESMSDVFGSMFRQWRAQQTVASADWLIGADIMGSGAIARGYTCLRDMSDPGAEHCLAPQPSHYRDYKKGMDPHYSSGIANLAFHQAALAIAGKSWELTGQIWYRALTGFAPSPKLSMKAFASRTRQLARSTYQKQPGVYTAINQAWKDVGL